MFHQLLHINYGLLFFMHNFFSFSFRCCLDENNFSVIFISLASFDTNSFPIWSDLQAVTHRSLKLLIHIWIFSISPIKWLSVTSIWSTCSVFPAPAWLLWSFRVCIRRHEVVHSVFLYIFLSIERKLAFKVQPSHWTFNVRVRKYFTCQKLTLALDEGENALRSRTMKNTCLV